MIIFKLDELVPCLKDMETGDIYDTEVIRIRRKSVLSHYNKRTGWYINWSKFPESTEVYALVLKGTNDIQGMIAVEYNDEFQAVHVVWGCVAPKNNVWEYGKKKFSGDGNYRYYTIVFTPTYFTTAEQETAVTETIDGLLENEFTFENRDSDYTKLYTVYDYIC